MFPISRTDLAKRGSSLLLQPVRRRKRRRQAFRLRDRQWSGTRTLVPCKTYLLWSSLFRLRFLFSYVQSSSCLVLCLYATRFVGRDILIGTHEMIPLESQSGPFLIKNLARSTS